MLKKMLNTIGAKVTVSMLAITVLVIVIAISSYILSIRTEDNTRVVTESDIPSAILSVAMLDEIGDMNANVLEYVLGEAEEKEEFESNYREFVSFFTELKAAAVFRKRRLDEIDRLFNEYSNRARIEIFDRYNPESESWARQRVKALTEITGERLEDLLNELKESEIADAGSEPSFEAVLNDDLPGIRLYLEMVDEAGDMVNDLTKYTDGDESAKETFYKDSQTFEVYLSQLKPLEKRAAEVEALKEVQALYTVLRDGGIEVFQRYNPTDKIEAIAAIDRLEHEVFNRLEDLLDEVSGQASDVAYEALYELRGLTENNILIMAGMVGTVILFCLLMVYYAYRSIVRPITDLITSMQTLSKGNTDVEVLYQSRDDEIGSMAESIEVFKQSLIARSDAEQALMEAKDRAESASRAKARFLATMSHEIRTPMNGVIGMIDLMMESAMTPDQRSIMKTVRESSFSLLNIINDILDFSKIEAGKLELEHVGFDLNGVVESVVDTMQISAKEKRVCLDLYTDLNIPLELIGDPLRLRQVVFNIIGNAIKFSAQAGKDGHVWVRTRLVSSENNRVQIQLQVIDNGIGIRKEDLENLFLPFTQAESSTTRRFGGTGLGLAICHNLVALMGGEVKVESHYGHGATFNIDLPLSIGRQKGSLSFESSNLILLLDIQDNGLRDQCQEYLNHLNIESLSLGGRQSQKELIQQYLDQGIFVVLVKDHNQLSPLDVLFHRFNHFKQLLLIHNFQMNSGIINGYTYAIEGHPFKVSALMMALDILLGRESPEVPEEQNNTQIMPLPESIQQAEKQRRLVLVVEDNLVNQDVISRQLKTLGYLCVVAEDGIEAERMYDLYEYTLVLTDCHMPRRDGYELARMLKHKQKEQGNFVPIIAITANALLGEAEKCYEAGMDDYLAKPVELSKLKKALDQWGKVRSADQADGSTKVLSSSQLEAINNGQSLSELIDPDSETNHDLSTPQGEVDSEIPVAGVSGQSGLSEQSKTPGLESELEEQAPKLTLDEKVIESIYGGELDDYRDSLQDFQELVLPNIAHIHEHISDDLSVLKAKLHQYKSPAKAVGVTAIADLLEEAEALCIDESASIEQIRMHIVELQKILPEVDNMIKAKLALL